MLSPQFGFVAGENTIFQPLFGKSTDSGLNWDFTAFYLNNNEGRATGVDFTDLNTGYVSARVWDGTGAIAKSTDGGSSWLSTLFTNPLWSIDFPISSASQVGYAVGSQGTILKTYNAGANWQSQISGTSLRLNKVHFKDFDFGFAVGENGIILRTISGGEPATRIDDYTNPPAAFELFQNYPNPFNPTTVISYQLPVSSNVILKVYDVLGNEIATLVNEEKPAGEYEVKFNASSGIGDLVSGIYFYQIKSGSFIQTKKMVLIK
ncbi:MAG: T9SS type A sorting domain-containing protein [Ignavibacteriaceae bacterium]|nr:T9SS type A sorting domain-containing protein [Ignavibacteriaceae bacterium]